MPRRHSEQKKRLRIQLSNHKYARTRNKDMHCKFSHCSDVNERNMVTDRQWSTQNVSFETTVLHGSVDVVGEKMLLLLLLSYTTDQRKLILWRYFDALFWELSVANFIILELWSMGASPQHSWVGQIYGPRPTFYKRSMAYKPQHWDWGVGWTEIIVWCV